MHCAAWLSSHLCLGSMLLHGCPLYCAWNHLLAKGQDVCGGPICNVRGVQSEGCQFWWLPMVWKFCWRQPWSNASACLIPCLFLPFPFTFHFIAGALRSGLCGFPWDTMLQIPFQKGTFDMVALQWGSLFFGAKAPIALTGSRGFTCHLIFTWHPSGIPTAILHRCV